MKEMGDRDFDRFQDTRKMDWNSRAGLLQHRNLSAVRIESSLLTKANMVGMEKVIS